MKKCILLICFALLATYGKTDPTHPFTGNEKIELQGKLDVHAGPDDVEAYFDDYAVYVFFYEDFGTVSVTLCSNASGLVYGTNINTSTQHYLMIPFSSYSGNTFTITLSNGTGYAEGEFNRAS